MKWLLLRGNCDHKETTLLHLKDYTYSFVRQSQTIEFRLRFILIATPSGFFRLFPQYNVKRFKLN